MADALPPIHLELSPAGEPVVIVGEAPVTTPRKLIEAVPELREPDWVVLFADVMNHMTHGFEYELIVDPVTFKSDYLAAYEAEDPTEQSVPGQVRLRDYGKPDFDAIQGPAMVGDDLVFYAREAFLGIPYKVTVDSDYVADYAPVSMTPDAPAVVEDDPDAVPAQD